MRLIFIGLLTLLFVTFLPVYAEGEVKLEIIYPKNGAVINASSVNFVGNTDPCANLTINNQSVSVAQNGVFVYFTGLKRGINNIIIKSSTQHASREIKYIINVPEYEKTIPSKPVKIIESSIYPNKNLEYKEGDVLSVSFKGSTGLKASFSIGEKIQNIPLTEQPPKNISSAPVYGKSAQLSTMPVKGIYKGFYKIKPEDNFKDEAIKIELSSGKETVSAEAKGKITTISTEFLPLIAEITKDYAVTRTAPDQSRLTPLPAGTLLNITGKIGNTYRFKYSETMDGWISENDVKLLPAGNFIPETIVNLLNIDSDENYVYLTIPAVEKTPFLITQNAENKMVLKLFGVKSGVDLFSYDNAYNFIKELSWNQDSKDCLSLTIKTNSKQFWGYKYYYEGDSLVLKLRKPPQIDPYCPLKDIVICLDAGHGGDEKGALGPTGIPEKTINLGITGKLRNILEQKGARVIMTRDSDKDVGLNDRINIANSNEAQIIISIHNNSLPDGRNPYEDHGTSSYYYHPQSLPLAKTLQQSLAETTSFKDFGVFYDSLMLTRPSEALSVLLEIGFMINPDEYNLLITPEFQEKTAQGIAQGLENFLLNQLEYDSQLQN